MEDSRNLSLTRRTWNIEILSNFEIFVIIEALWLILDKLPAVFFTLHFSMDSLLSDYFCVVHSSHPFPNLVCEHPCSELPAFDGTRQFQTDILAMLYPGNLPVLRPHSRNYSK